MSNQPYLVPLPLYDWMIANSLREPDVLRRLREETAVHPRAIMQIPPEQGQFFRLLVELLDVRKALEIGVFTGYSSLSVALAMPPEGGLIACDVSEEFTSVARRYWAEAGVAEKIDLRIGAAAKTLQRLIDEGHAGTFDFAFIDADKPTYGTYYELSLQLLRQGGLMVIDNVFQYAKVADPENQEEGTVALRELSARIYSDQRVTLSMLPVADGLTLVRKIG